MTFCNDMPVLPGTHLPVWILTWLVDLGIFLLIAGAVFYIAGEFDRFKSPRNLVPYAAITVSFGLVVDALFLLLADGFMPINPGPEHFYDFLRSGGFDSSAAFQGFRFLLLPSAITFVLLGLIQAVLITYLLRDRIDKGKIVVMSAIIAFVSLPTWLVIYLLSRPATFS